MIQSTELNNLYKVYQKYKENLLIEQLANEYNTFDFKNIDRLKCLSRLKIRALGSIIKIHKNSTDEEIKSATVNYWFELRAEWIRHNTVNNYNMVFNGTSDATSVILSSFISKLLEDIEKLLSVDELNRMNDIMVQVQNGF